MAEHVAPRVNSARLNNYVGRPVRLTCKVLRLQGDVAIVEATDGGQIEVRLTRDPNMNDPFVEFIGTVVDSSTLKMMACINLGSDLDMKLANDVVELIHGPQPEIHAMFFDS